MLPACKIFQLVNEGATFIINHSGGKDSQAQAAHLRAFVPDAQLVVVHAHLEGVEWDGVQEHIQATTLGLEYHVVRAQKTFLGMVESRGMWPSSTTRQCTSDLKRDPISKLIRQLCKDRGITTVVNCMGIRADESAARAKKDWFKVNERQSKNGRTVYELYPIFRQPVAWVWETIRKVGQVPHWAYRAGMSRLSCCFCIMASQADLKTAAYLVPDMLRRIVALEIKTGHTFVAPKKGQPALTLDKVLGIDLDTLPAGQQPVYNPETLAEIAELQGISRDLQAIGVIKKSYC